MTTVIKSVNELLKEAIEGYRRMCGKDSEPSIFCCAPGRVNLIGGHVDYNEGFVLPMALPMVTVCVGGPTSSTDGCLLTTNAFIRSKPFQVERIQLPVTESYFDEESNNARKTLWTDYIVATICRFAGHVKPFAMSIASSVPLGGGLSSSAALEVGVYTFLELLDGETCSKSVTKALACQKAEHLVGIPCGIMDQFVSVMAKSGSLLFIDCRSLSTEDIVLQNTSIGVLITNSNVKHKLSESEYPLRRKMCQEAAKLLGVKSLRDGSLSKLHARKEEISEDMFKRAFHVITEIQRTSEAVTALKNEDHRKFGDLITASHESLRDNFDVSCKELDQLVEIANRVDGVYGSRLVGGGFGGCTVTWLEMDQTQAVIDAIKRQYDGNATFFICQPSEGARMLCHPEG